MVGLRRYNINNISYNFHVVFDQLLSIVIAVRSCRGIFNIFPTIMFVNISFEEIAGQPPFNHRSDNIKRTLRRSHH